MHNTKECKKWNEDGTPKKSRNPLLSITRPRAFLLHAISKLTAEVHKLKKESKTKRSSKKSGYYSNSDSDSE